MPMSVERTHAVTGISVAIKVMSSIDGVFSLSWQLDNITSK